MKASYPNYPKNFAAINSWSKENRVHVTEGRVRFAQYCVLLAVAESNTLRNLLVLKGGNALDFIWQPNRSTKDLDFSASSVLSKEKVQTLFAPSLASVTRKYGVALRFQSIKQQPKGKNKTFITYRVLIGYALEDDRNNLARLKRNENSLSQVFVDISLNEVICAYNPVKLDDTTRHLLVSTLEDIVAEKLRSLLQQPLRNRNRKQDLLDIAVVLQGEHQLDKSKVSNYLQQKAEARNVPVHKDGFRSEAVRDRAKLDYAELQKTTRTTFIEFEEAWKLLISFIDTLEIPDKERAGPQ